MLKSLAANRAFLAIADMTSKFTDMFSDPSKKFEPTLPTFFDMNRPVTSVINSVHCAVVALKRDLAPEEIQHVQDQIEATTGKPLDDATLDEMLDTLKPNAGNMLIFARTDEMSLGNDAKYILSKAGNFKDARSE